ncbi:MAG TPA: phospholipid-binding protein [Beijerinckiaceae bacterium]|nr:phospholipid-binding protein [Beijerinckiaceae bacterium]
MKPILAATGLILAATGGAQALSLKASWGSAAGCGGQSPAFVLGAVPKGTAKLDFKMVDLDLPSYPHGGGSVAFAGKSSFAAGEVFGAFSSYRGPCPPPGQTHRYEWSVQAIDAAGKVLGTAKTVLPFKR